ncbi:MAG TPA: hotdog domain-containing protein [Bacillota bacterium]
MTVMIRLRVSEADAHYGGGLVAGSYVMGLFGDVATELLIRRDGDEGLFVAYDLVEFKAPVRAGDYLEVTGRITHEGRTSRKMEFEAWRVIGALPEINDSAAEVLPSPVLVARASGTCVVTADKQRRSGPAAGGD